MAIGRREVLSLYRKAGLEGTGMLLTSRCRNFELIHTEVEVLRCNLTRHELVVRRLEDRMDWQLDIPFRPSEARPSMAVPSSGRSENALDRLDRCREIINADVIDAWFPIAKGY